MPPCSATNNQQTPPCTSNLSKNYHLAKSNILSSMSHLTIHTTLHYIKQILIGYLSGLYNMYILFYFIFRMILFIVCRSSNHLSQKRLLTSISILINSLECLINNSLILQQLLIQITKIIKIILMIITNKIIITKQIIIKQKIKILITKKLKVAKIF